MPLLLSKQINDHSAYAVWKISETPIVLSEQLEEKPSSVHPHKLSEWIVGRILIKNLCEIFDLKYQGVTYDETGKPTLINNTAEISITHSFPYGACILNLDYPCGIDLELPRQKMSTVRDKFLHPSEYQYEKDLVKLTKIWSIKEVLYKIWAKRGVSMREQMWVEFNNDDSPAIGFLEVEGTTQEHVIATEEIAGYLLSFNIA